LVPAVLVPCAIVSAGAVVEATGVYPIGEGRGWIGRVYRRTDAALAQVTQETWPLMGGWGPSWSGAPNTHERADHKNHKK
jgi:hypothetical protein